MKKLFLLSFMMFMAMFAAQAQTPVAPPTAEDPNKPKATITFEESSHDFGDIVQGEKVTHTFKFRNTGKAPLIISNVQTTCGCTVPTWPKNPIPPKQAGEITATFNSAGKMGKTNKVITIYSNASNAEERVSIITNILPPKAEATPVNNNTTAPANR